jgi:hypothetical protein
MPGFSGWLFQGYGPRQLTHCAGGTGGQVRPAVGGFLGLVGGRRQADV